MLVDTPRLADWHWQDCPPRRSPTSSGLAPRNVAASSLPPESGKEVTDALDRSGPPYFSPDEIEHDRATRQEQTSWMSFAELSWEEEQDPRPHGLEHDRFTVVE